MRQCFVVCTRRKSQNIWEPVNTNVKHIILDVDLPSSRHILKRYFISKNYQKAALKNLFAINPDLMYVEGLDSLMIANKYRALNKAVHIFLRSPICANTLLRNQNRYLQDL